MQTRGGKGNVPSSKQKMTDCNIFYSEKDQFMERILDPESEVFFPWNLVFILSFQVSIFVEGLALSSLTTNCLGVWVSASPTPALV